MEQHTMSNSNATINDKFAILVVEDNFLIRRMIKKSLEKFYVIFEADDTESAVGVLETANINLVILDIHLGSGKKDGIWLGEKINEKFRLPFIYLTAYFSGDIPERALATKPSSYITKPFKEVDFVLAVKIALQKYLQENPLKHKWILVKEEEFYVKLYYQSIDYFESSGNYLLVYAQNKIFKIRSTIQKMMLQLPSDLFDQVHRGYIVNKSKVVKYNKDSVIVGNKTIPISDKKTFDGLA